MFEKYFGKINWDNVMTALGVIGTFFLLIILFAFLFGGPMTPFLAGMGLEIPEFKGIFINCSDPKNKDDTFCRPLPQRWHADNDNSLYHKEAKTLPFNLSK